MPCGVPSIVLERRCACGRCAPACMPCVDVDGVSAERVHTVAAAAGVESMPLSSYYFGGGRPPNALFLGFGAVPPAAIRAGINKLARVIESVKNDEM